jgi:hypothetical protein
MSGAIRPHAPDAAGATATLEALDAVCTDLLASLTGAPARRVDELRTDLHGPLSLVVAGGRRSGVSTLLNAIVGERLAPTGGPTSNRTSYRPGPSLHAVALAGDERWPLVARRTERGPIEVDRDPAVPAWADVVVDTPLRAAGLAFVDAGAFRPGVDGRSAARRHLSAPRRTWPMADVAVHVVPAVAPDPIVSLASLLDESLGVPSARAAIAVVSRADEVGDGGRDAFAAATRVAHELRNERTFVFACATVLPVSGLLAEAADALHDAELDDLRAILSAPSDQVADALASVNRFCHPALVRVPVERRHGLVARLGLAGIGVCLRTLHARPSASLDVVAQQLREASGIDRLLAEIDVRFVTRRTEIKVGTALARLRVVLASLEGGADADLARAAAARVATIERSDPAVAERRALHLVASGAVRLSDAETREVAAAMTGTCVADRMGQPPATPQEALVELVAAARRRWSILGSSPAIDQAMVDVCNAMRRRLDTDASELAGPG